MSNTLEKKEINKASVSRPVKVAVLGAGSFGSVLANLMAGNGHDVRLWVRNEEQLGNIRETGKNEAYLQNFVFHEGLIFEAGLAETVDAAELVFLAVPSKAFRTLLPELKQLLNTEVALVSTAKGIEAEGFRMMSEVVSEIFPENPVAALSGPNIAQEIANGELTGSVIAGKSLALNAKVQSLLSSSRFRVYDNTDIYGVELAGALKNIYAIAAGMSNALGLGQNARSMLLTRSLAEMSRFAVEKGANPMTFLGLAGVGDLFVTCTSPLSRNFRFGELVAKGNSVDQALKQISSTVEGYASVKTVAIEAEKKEIYMPLVSALEKILYQNAGILDVVEDLMLGDNNHDVEFQKGG